MSKTNTPTESLLQVQSNVVSINGTNVCLHRWQQQQQQQPTNTTTTTSSTPKALAIVYHGLLAHGLYPTVKYAAECLALSSSSSSSSNHNNNHNLVVVSVDLPGHGRADGLRGYLSSADQLLQDAVAICNYARKEFLPQGGRGGKVFLIGSSMGGTIALNVASKLQSTTTAAGSDDDNDDAGVVAGVVLLAPMLRLSVSSLEHTLLGGLATLFSTWQIIPSSSSSPEKQYRDETKRAECQNDEFSTVGGGAKKCIRVGSAYTCVSLAQQMTADFYASLHKIPLLIMVADEDVVVNNQGSLDLMEHAVNCPDKMIKHYPALHGLLCEPSPLVEEIEKDMVEWVQARIPQ